MGDLLPDLTGRPDWVVIVAIALLVVGMVALRWVSRNAGASIEDDEDQEGDRPDQPPGPRHAQVTPGEDASTALVLTKALDLLAKEAVESQGARADADAFRAQLLACSAERDRIAVTLAKAQAELEQCNRECRRLAMRALERGGDSGE
jgi:hypothetical protein